MTAEKVSCDTHGEAYEAYVCKHLVGASGLTWHSHEPSEEHPWPDAWCGQCHVAFEREGEWNEKSEVGVNIKLICHQCYERTKKSCSVLYV